jgi:ubiquinone/menaquinone biosynthesis C-methylase UbiE
MTGIPAIASEGIHCRVCNNTNPEEFRVVYDFSDFVVVECHRCKFNFIPYAYRKNIKYHQYKDADVTAAIRAGNNWVKIQRHKLRLQFIKKHSPHGSLFDLGAGWGHFMQAAKEVGYSVKGIEISEQQATYAREDLKLPVIHGDFFEMPEAEKFDVITMWDVLEHIDLPDLLLDKCSRISKPGGMVYILIPQVDSFVAKRAKKQWNMVGLDHVNYFSKKTITQLLNRYGYEVVEIRSSIEIKLFIMYTLLPWIKRLKGRSKKSLREVNQTVTAAERQRFFNRFTSMPKWILRMFVAVHNVLYNLLSWLKIGDEMVIAARLKRQ